MVLAVSVVISTVSIIYTNILVEQIREREEKLIALYARTLEYFANQSDNTDLNFIFEEIVLSNRSIPVIQTDELNKPIQWKNLPDVENASSEQQRKSILQRELRQMELEHEPILITLRSNEGTITGYQFIYYKNSLLLAQLRYYPVAQLSIIAIFGMIAFMAFNYSKTAEQNRVWVGMAKETAHQLGTPLSSLMAWVEYLREDENLKDGEIVAQTKQH